MSQHPLNLGHETLIGHAVGFVNVHYLDGAQIAFLGLDDVDESKGRGDDDLDALFQFVDLLVPGRPAIHGEHPPTTVFTDRRQHLGDWSASSRWERAQARGLRAALGRRSGASIGIPKAKVLPEPVRARPQRSSPVKATGIAAV